MSGPRPDPEDYIPYAQRYEELHDRIVTDDRADEAFHSKISNRKKLEYICRAQGLSPMLFHVDLPLPLEDWLVSDDVCNITTGLYFSDLRRQFYNELIAGNQELRKTPAWHRQGNAQFWCHSFNSVLQKRLTGKLIEDERVLH